MSGAALPHRDEQRIIEDHHQTEHKLDLIRRYFGAYLAIIANARRLRNRNEAWVIDTHAGAGLHRSREDPDGRRAGSPIIACNRARLTQRFHPEFKVHVRAIEKHPVWAMHLDQRVAAFRRAAKPEDVVDVKVLSGDFANYLPAILAEATANSATSLWFVDPYGFKEIPFVALRPLLRPNKGPEVLINLDLTGIWRKVGAATDIADIAEVLEGPDEGRALRALYGGTQWQNALKPGASYADNLESLARLYAERFSAFQFRRIYRLLSSDGQVRFMVHLAHVERAATAFERCYEDSLKGGLLAGRALDNTTRAQAAHQLFEANAATTTSIDELYESAAFPFDRGQLRVVLREADSRGFGRFNEETGMMEWAMERQRDGQAELPFG